MVLKAALGSVDGATVEMIVAVVGVIGSVIVALLARLAGLTKDDRSRARIARDAELWKALPEESAARVPLGDYIADATEKLLEERQQDHTLDRLWNIAAWLAFATWLFLLVFTAMSPNSSWVVQVQLAVLVAAGVAGVLALVFFAFGVRVGAPRLWAWVKGKLHG